MSRPCPLHREIFQGPRGGYYYLSGGGRKVYCRPPPAGTVVTRPDNGIRNLNILVPATPITPEVPKVTNHPPISQPPVTPITPEVPVTPITPEVPVTPITPEVPVTPITPEVPVTPIIPEVPVATNNPPISRPPVTPIVPVTADHHSDDIINLISEWSGFRFNRVESKEYLFDRGSTQIKLIIKDSDRILIIYQPNSFHWEIKLLTTKDRVRSLIQLLVDQISRGIPHVGQGPVGTWKLLRYLTQPWIKDLNLRSINPLVWISSTNNSRLDLKY